MACNIVEKAKCDSTGSTEGNICNSFQHVYLELSTFTSFSLLPCVERLPFSHGKAFVLYATKWSDRRRKRPISSKVIGKKPILVDIRLKEYKNNRPKPDALKLLATAYETDVTSVYPTWWDTEWTFIDYGYTRWTFAYRVLRPIANQWFSAYLSFEEDSRAFRNDIPAHDALEIDWLSVIYYNLLVSHRNMNFTRPVSV